MRSLFGAGYTVCVGAALLVAALVLPRSRVIDVLVGERTYRPDPTDAAMLVLVAVVAVVAAVVGLRRRRPWLVAAAGVPGFLTALAWSWYVVDLRSGNRDTRQCVHDFFCTDVVKIRPEIGAYVVVAAGLLMALGGALAALTTRRAAAQSIG